jgi:HEAT repeat protein
MPGKRSFEEQLSLLDALRTQTPPERLGPLRKALAHKNNYVVARAADLAREFSLNELIPDLLAAFDRFFVSPAKTDPQCWAKNAVSRVLMAFEHQDAAVFLRGLRHIQMEPVWGGQSDTAGTLRGTCAHALVQCRTLHENDLLALLIDLLGDKDKSVRVEAARAVEAVGSASAALLLRLRVTLAADEPEVLGACFGGILRIEGKTAIPWLSRFLAAGDDVAAEAALALASDRSPQAYDALRDPLVNRNVKDSWFRSVLLSAIALTRQDSALIFLLELVQSESLDAESAIESILRGFPSSEAGRQLAQAVEGNARLTRALAAHRAASS